MAVQVPISNGFYESRHLAISHQRCSNCYVHFPEQPSLSDAQILFTPGITQLTTTGTLKQKNRGSHVMAGLPYFVNGNSLYRIDRSSILVSGVGTFQYTYTELGTIEGSGSVGMADNGTQLVVLVPGGKGYVWNGTTLAEITDTDFTANGNPQTVNYIDGYFLYTTDSKKFIISALNDATSYSALDFTSAEADPDNIVASIVLNNVLYILGSETTEGFQNNPTVGTTPFVRNGLVLDTGCRAPFSLVKIASSFFMVGAGVNDATAVFQFTSNGFKKISTDAIDYLLSTLDDMDIDEIVGMSYAAEGAYFVIWNLPDTTICYDLVSQKWHERNSLISEEVTTWRVNSLVSAYGLILVGDSVDGRVGSLSLNALDEYGTHIIRLFTTQPFAKNGDEIALSMIELTMASGAGNEDVEDPVVSMSASNDGKTFSNERIRKIGKVGKYGRRVVWYRNGRFDRFVVLLFRVSEPIDSAFIKLEVE